MDIPSKLPPGHPEAAVDHAKGAGTSGGSPKVCKLSPSAGERVHLSPAAGQVTAAKETLRKTPEVDLKKVAEIKARLQQGLYAVDSQATAAKLLQESLLDGVE